MSSGEGNGFGTVPNVVAYDYFVSDDKKCNSNKAPRFNGDLEEFSWWKTNMYSHIVGLDK